MLAQVERQLGNAKAASDAVAAALRAPDARAQLLDVAEADMFAFELHRDANEQAEAKQALDAALTAALSARQQRATPASRARAERLLGRILEQYGETKGAARAFERARSPSPRPTGRRSAPRCSTPSAARSSVATLLAARTTLKRGLEGNVWRRGGPRVRLRPVGGSSSSASRRRRPTAPSSARSTPGRTRRGPEQAHAVGERQDHRQRSSRPPRRAPTQKVEAAFYTAMARKVAGDPGAVASLRAVASAPVLDLLEVQLAREIVAPEVRSSLPGGVQAP